jgi:hypothetical protein
MKIEKTNGGFERIEFGDVLGSLCSLQQSSRVGGPSDWTGRPGGSYLWLGLQQHGMHLSRAQVAELVQHLQQWLATGSFQAEVPR